MPTTNTTVATSDGTCPVTLHTPEGEGPWPGVIMYTDVGGVRDTFHQMATKLAAFGYAVLLPDVYYRHGAWAPFDMQTVFTDPDERPRLLSMLASVTNDMAAADAPALVDYLSQHPDVSPGPFGACGYCMGGRISVVVASSLGDRIGAAGAFHAGGLVTDESDSPHLGAGSIKAQVYIAGAENDKAFTIADGEVLAQALSASGVKHTIDFYPATHGFAVPDNPPYDADADNRHWTVLRELFGAALGD